MDSQSEQVNDRGHSKRGAKLPCSEKGLSHDRIREICRLANEPESKGCGKEITIQEDEDGLGDIIYCGGMDDFNRVILCPSCKAKETK